MRIAIAGGGPGGLYLSILLKRLDPAHEVAVYERNAPDDTFGFGVVFSDETLGAFEAADPESYAEITRRFARWTEIDVHYGGEVVTSGGHGFSAMGRMELLNLLQRRAADLGVELHFKTEVAELEGDVVVAADGVNSTLRRRHADSFQPSLDVRRCKYVWFGTDLVFDAFKFFIKQTPHGVLQVHGYPYSDARSTFIVETTEETWSGLGLDERDPLEACEELFADVLDGHRLIANKSQWINFTTVRNASWRHENVVLLGDAAHTAHFSIGSGTKLAMEDAISLAWHLREHDVPAALEAYETERRAIVESTQRAAQGSLEWFEGLGRYTHQDPLTFAFNLLTRCGGSPTASCRCATRGSSPAWPKRPPMFTPAAPARARAGQPRRGLADGHVLLGGRHAGRLPPGAPGRAGDRRRGPADDGDDLHVGRRRGSRPAAAACAARSTRRRGSGSSTSCMTTRGAAIGAQIGHAGRKGSTCCCGRATTGRSRRATGR